MIYLRPAQYARKHGVSRARVSVLIKEGKLPVYDYKCGVVLIDESTPYPRKTITGRPIKNINSVNGIK